MRGIIGTAISLVLAATIYFAFIKPNLNDVQKTGKDALNSITQTQPSKSKRGQRNAERFARCVQRDPSNVEHDKRCRAKYLK